MLVPTLLLLACAVADPANAQSRPSTGRVVHDHARKWYRDADGDGHGDPGTWQRALTRPTGHVANATDCDDDRDDVSPRADEIAANGRDDDCDGTVDDGAYDDATAVISTHVRATQLGYGGISTGDVDADGTADLQIAAPFRGGAIYLLSGPLEGEVAAERAVTIVGDTDLPLGKSVAVGDLNGDGAADIVAPEWWDTTYLFLGPVTSDLGLADAEAFFPGPELSGVGDSVAIAPDVDGDARPDVVISAAWAGMRNEGLVYVVSGDASGRSPLGSSAVYTFRGNEEDDFLGMVVYAIGDLDGDGIDDLALSEGTSQPSAADAVHLVPGGLPPGTYEIDAAASATIRPSADYDRLGEGVSSGDYDGDGTLDLFVGDPWADSAEHDFPGFVYALLGPFPGDMSVFDAHASWVGSADRAYIGEELAADDFDGDGALDLAIGAPQALVSEGAVYLQLGAATGTVEVDTLPVFVGGDADDELGSRLATVPDWDGDGDPELAISAHWFGEDQNGAVFVFDSTTLF